jgi:hypothetical protein
MNRPGAKIKKAVTDVVRVINGKSQARPHIRIRDSALSGCWSYLQHRYRPVFGSCPRRKRGEHGSVFD